LREALARSDHDFLLSEPVRSRKSRRRNGPFGALLGIFRFARRAADYPNRIAGALLVSLVIAISVNALVLQRGRHPAPLFGKSVVMPVLAPQTPVVKPQVVAPLRAAQPARDPIGQFMQSSGAPSGELAAAPDALNPRQRSDAKDDRPAIAAKPAPNDPISQLLKSDATRTAPPSEQSETVRAAQRALIKLGFVLKPDGRAGGATRQAIEQFERDRGLPVHGELSPKILHRLSVESGLAIE
jgi:hypothetical protein